MNHMAELNYKAVLVIRNPFKALISHRHLDVGGHTGYAPKSHFSDKGILIFYQGALVHYNGTDCKMKPPYIINLIIELIKLI